MVVLSESLSISRYLDTARGLSSQVDTTARQLNKHLSGGMAKNKAHNTSDFQLPWSPFSGVAFLVAISSSYSPRQDTRGVFGFCHGVEHNGSDPSVEAVPVFGSSQEPEPTGPQERHIRSISRTGQSVQNERTTRNGLSLPRLARHTPSSGRLPLAPLPVDLSCCSRPGVATEFLWAVAGPIPPFHGSSLAAAASARQDRTPVRPSPTLSDPVLRGA